MRRAKPDRGKPAADAGRVELLRSLLDARPGRSLGELHQAGFGVEDLVAPWRT